MRGITYTVGTGTIAKRDGTHMGTYPPIGSVH